MPIYTDKIREISARLLRNGSVDMVIGFRKGTVPMTNEPCFITRAEEVSSLIWDYNCRANLANYLIGCKGKVAIISKGCDSRNIVTHITENKVDRDKIYVIGVPCSGMIDRKKIGKLLTVTEITKIQYDNNKIIVETKNDNNSIILNKNDVLQNNCITCTHNNPVISDELVAESIEKQPFVDEYFEINKIEEMNFNNRYKYFSDLFSSCIRCYACRNVCPLCYCPTCFVDESKPQWLSKGQDDVDIKIFHFLRAYHCAGRCTDCGSCEQACPVGINMRLLTKKMVKDCKEKFSWESGLSLDHRPALDFYKTEDPDEFIM